MERKNLEMKRAILVVGLLGVLLTMAFGQENSVRATVPFEFDEGAQLGSAYPEITHWPAHEIVSADARMDEGAQLGSAHPEITHWPEAVVDEGAQLGSAHPEVMHWPEPVMQVGTGRHISPGT